MKSRQGVPAVLPAILFLELVTLGATFPVIAYYVRELGGTGFHVTLCFSLTAAPKVVLLPLWGGLSDRIGRKPVMVMGLIGSLASYAGWALAPSLGWLLLSRLFMGAFGTQLTLATSIVADRLEPPRRAQGIGILGAAAGLGFIVGPLCGGLVAGATSYPFVGWVNVGLEGLAILLAVVFLPETYPGSSIPSTGINHTYRLWRIALNHPAVGRLLLVVLASTIGVSVLQGTFVLLAEDRWGYDVTQTATALALFFLVGVLVQGGAIRALVPCFGEVLLAQIGSFLTAAGIVLLVPEGPVPLLWIALLTVAVGVSLETPALTALLSQGTHADDQGKVQGLNQGATGLGRSLSGISMGWIYDQFGAPLPFALSGLLAFVGFLLLLPLRKRTSAAQLKFEIK